VTRKNFSVPKNTAGFAGISATPRAKGDGVFGARTIFADLMARYKFEILLFYKMAAKSF